MADNTLDTDMIGNGVDNTDVTNMNQFWDVRININSIIFQSGY